MKVTNIRDVDPKIWHQLKLEALKREIKIGDLLNEICRDWLDRQAKEGRG